MAPLIAGATIAAAAGLWVASPAGVWSLYQVPPTAGTYAKRTLDLMAAITATIEDWAAIQRSHEVLHEI